MPSLRLLEQVGTNESPSLFISDAPFRGTEQDLPSATNACLIVYMMLRSFSTSCFRRIPYCFLCVCFSVAASVLSGRTSTILGDDCGRRLTCCCLISCKLSPMPHTRHQTAFLYFCSLTLSFRLYRSRGTHSPRAHRFLLFSPLLGLFNAAGYSNILPLMPLFRPCCVHANEHQS